MNFFSIIVCAYNTEQYIERALDSIINQDFDDYQLIIVDDGSNDNTPSIIDSYKADNVIILHKDNEGAGLSRNCGMQYAIGKYVWFVDSDDEIEESALSFIHDALAQSDADLLRLNYRRIEPNNRYPVIEYASGIYEGRSLATFKHHFIERSQSQLFTGWMHIYKRDLIKDISYLSEKEVAFEDVFFNCEVYQYVKKAQIINSVFYRYYQRYGSLVIDKKRYCQRILRFYEKIKDKYIKLGCFDEYRNILCKAILNDAILGNGKPNEGALFLEIFGPDIETIFNQISEVLNSPTMSELLKYGINNEANDVLKDEYKLLENKDTEGIYCYLRDLSLKARRENNNETKI